MVMTWHGIRMANRVERSQPLPGPGDQPALGAEISRTGGA